MTEMLPLEAYTYLKSEAHALLIDVRSEVEYLFVGHAEAAIHIPWYLDSNWEINPMFLELLESVAGSRLRPLIFICRNGNRAREAAKCASELGFEHVYVVRYGFEGDINEQQQRGFINGWRYEGLPWVQC